MLQRMLLFVISFMVFLKYTDSAANVVRVCPTSSFDSCDFNTLEDAVVYANANEGTTVEICGPMTYQGAITPVSARTQFRCGNCLRTNNNKKKKNMKKTKSTKSFWSGSSSQSKRTKSSSSTGSSSSSNDPNSSSTSAQSRRSFSTRPSLQTRPKPTARTNTAVRTCGSSSDVQIIPQENANPTFPFGFADDGAETGITAGHTFIGLSFVEGSSGSSVLNCNFMCDPTQDVGGTGADITVEIGVSIFAADQILVQNNQFSNCYYGVYVSEGSLNEVSWNAIDVLSYAFPKAAPELASSGIIIIPAQQPVDPPTLPDFATQFNAIHDNCINVHGPTDDECTAGITGGAINDDLFFCGTGGGIIILDEDVFADTEMALKKMTSFNDIFQNQISRIGNPITTLWGILLFHRLNWASTKAFGCNFAINDNSIEQNFLDGLPILILGSDGNSILENDIVNIAATTGTVVGGADGGWWTTERLDEADTRLGRAVPVSARAIMVAQGSANCIVSNEALDTVAEDFYIGTQDRQTCQPWDNSLIENVGWELRIDDTTNGGVIDLVNRNTVFVGNVFRSGRCNADNTVDGITTCARVFILPPPGFEMVCEVRQDSDNGATSITTSDLP